MITTSSTTKFWFRLLDFVTGQPYKGTSTADFVSLPPGAVVAEFRKRVHSENSNKLAGVDASDLLVYENKAALFDNRSAAQNEGKVDPLDPTQSVDGLGSMEDMLVIVVPSSSSNATSSSSTPDRNNMSTTESRITREEPSLKRKDRWMAINEILEGNTKKPSSNNIDSTSYSSITWNQVKSIFDPVSYVQSQRAMDDAQLDFLAKYLLCTTKCFGAISTGKEAKRLHFIAPVFVCVCILLGGDDVGIAVEEDFTGKFIKAHGRFEFMIRRKKKAVCIVEAKKDDMEQGMAQDLVGCEVAAEVGGLDVVYGIVTNYVQWNFFCSRNEKVEMEECSLSLTSNGPETQSLKRVAEKIYSMLSD
jgi:hypothetical protein